MAGWVSIRHQAERDKGGRVMIGKAIAGALELLFLVILLMILW